MTRGLIRAYTRSRPVTCRRFLKAPHTPHIIATSAYIVAISLAATTANASYSPVVSPKIAAYSFPVAAIVGDRDSQPKREDTQDHQPRLAGLRR